MGRIFWCVVLVTVLVLVAEAPAEAYLDPGAGSILLQVLPRGVCRRRRSREAVLAEPQCAVSQTPVDRRG